MPSTAISTTSQANTPTEFVSQPTSTPEPTPSPEPLCECVATSCKELYQCNPALPSGYYNITTSLGAERVYCVMNTTNCGNITGGWMRAAYIDMTNENNTCPQGLTYTVVSSTRMCTRSHTGSYSCSSVTFPTHGVPYTRSQGPTGPSGPEGPTGPPGALNHTERQQLKEEILATVREEMSMLSNTLCERISTCMCSL